MEGPGTTNEQSKRKRGQKQVICSSLKVGYCKFMKSVLVSKIQKRSRKESERQDDQVCSVQRYAM